MDWEYNDGGRSNYFKGDAGDCVTRAIAIATGQDYKQVYEEVSKRSKLETAKQLKKHRNGKRSSARNGVFKETWKKYLDDLGWKKHSTSGGRKGVSCHLNDSELPKGTLIVQIAKHLTCVKDGILHDTYDCSKISYIDQWTGETVTNSNRAVYAYWTKEDKSS